jgi:hypothetical protein
MKTTLCQHPDKHHNTQSNQCKSRDNVKPRHEPSQVNIAEGLAFSQSELIICNKTNSATLICSARKKGCRGEEAHDITGLSSFNHFVYGKVNFISIVAVN